MSKYEKIIFRILQGQSDANINFDDLRQLLIRMDFEERISGSHHIFRKALIEEKINLQRDGNKAKVYQVKQIRNMLLNTNSTKGNGNAKI